MPARFRTAAIRARFAYKVWRAEDHPRDPRTGRFIPKPGGPKRRRRPSARNHVASAGAYGLVERARAAMPKDAAGWRDSVVTQVRPAERSVDRRVAEMRQELAKDEERLRVVREELEAEFRRKRTPRRLREGIARERLWLEQSNVNISRNSLAHMERLAADPDLLARDSSAAALSQMLPAEEVIEYPRDPSGRRMPPDAYQKALDGVLTAGEAIHDDFLDALQRDRQIDDLTRVLETEYTLTAIKNRPPEEREQAFARRNEIRHQIKRREQELLMQLLKSVRGFGGVTHAKAARGTAEDARSYATSGAMPGREDWRERLAEAEAFFPDDWLAISADKPITIIKSGRAFHAHSWDEQSSTLSMPTEARDNDVYSGAFRDYTHEVTVHEMGHRMEMAVPGLRELEFTFVRRRSTGPDGRLESTQKMRDIYRQSGYSEDEVAFPDQWAHAYTGKTYEAVSHLDGAPIDNDPARGYWEVFQVGLQDTLGRGARFGDLQMQYFVLGALATLSRDDSGPKRPRRRRR